MTIMVTLLRLLLKKALHEKQLVVPENESDANLLIHLRENRKDDRRISWGNSKIFEWIRIQVFHTWNHPKVHVAYHSASNDTWSPYPHKQHRCPHILDLSPGRISSVGRNFSNPTWWSPFIVSTSEETELDRDDAHVVGTSHTNICPTGQLFIISSFPNDPPSANKSRSHKIKELPSHWHANSKLTLEARVSKTIKGGWFHYYAAINLTLKLWKPGNEKVIEAFYICVILHDGTTYNIRVNSNRWKGKVVFGIDFLFTFWFDLSRIRAKQRHPEEPVVPGKEK